MNCENNFVFDRNTLSCVTYEECKKGGYGSNPITGYGQSSNKNYDNGPTPTPYGPPTDHVFDKFSFIRDYPHDIYRLLNTYYTAEELERMPIDDTFLRRIAKPRKYISPYKFEHDADDLNLYEPIFGPTDTFFSGYINPKHGNQFIDDDFMGDEEEHPLPHYSNYVKDMPKHQFVEDRFMEIDHIDEHHPLNHDYKSPYVRHGDDHEFIDDRFFAPIDHEHEGSIIVDNGHHHPPHNHDYNMHHSNNHMGHYNYEINHLDMPNYDNNDMNQYIYEDSFKDHHNYEQEFYDDSNYQSPYVMRRKKRSLSAEGKEEIKTNVSIELFPMFDHSIHAIQSATVLCNSTNNGKVSIGFCTEEFVNCLNPNESFIQSCENRNVFDAKVNECVPYQDCVHHESSIISRSLEDNDILDDSYCAKLGDGTYYLDGCGKYFVVCKDDKMSHMHCPRDMYFDINRFQCDYSENIDACKHTLLKNGGFEMDVPIFNCKNVPNGFIGSECSNVFAYCHNEIVSRKFRCPRNHVFDAIARLCVLPEMLKACDDSPLFNDPHCVLKPDSVFGTHCSSMIHHCLNGRHYTYPCGRDRYLNNATMKCLPLNEIKECKEINLRSMEEESLCKVGELRLIANEPCSQHYITCLKSGEQLPTKCDEGLVFDEQLSICVPKEQCIIKYSLNDTIAETTEVPVYIQKNESLLVIDPICNGKKENEFVSTGLCKREYIECIKTTAVRRACDNEFIFSTSKNLCVYMLTSEECEFPKFDEVPTNENVSFDPANFCIGKENRLYRNPENCTIALRCHEGQTHAAYSCASGLVFDENHQKCDYAQKFQRCIGYEDTNTVSYDSLVDVECTISNHGTFIPDTSDCSKYYRCVWGTLIERRCPPSTQFNPKFSVCDTPINPETCEF
uniref:Chitin-binding type-2 domain-containing protein n=1 Tax=Parastrongyloides trichosuri TaxID=131310 RepID=A0A0N4Z6T4_PARTI